MSTRDDLRHVSDPRLLEIPEEPTGRERAILETVRIPVLTMDPVRDDAGTIVDFTMADGNAAAARINGVAPADLIGQRLSPRLETDVQQELFDAYVDVLENGGTLHRVVDWQHEGRLWARLEVSARRYGDQVIVSFRDVMNDETVQQELRHTNERLHLAERELTARAEAHRDFVSVASHELRTPLATLRGFAELLRAHGEQLGTEEVRAALDAILRNVERQTRIIESLVDASSLVTGTITTRAYRLEVRPLLERVVKEVPPAVARTTIDCDPSLTVLADDGMLTQVLVALLTNAVKYGGEHVRLVARADSGECTIAVIDDGPGVDPAFVPELFQMFTQESHASRRTARGAGLGLSLAKGFAEALDGRLGYRAAPDGGACFELRLPRV